MIDEKLKVEILVRVALADHDLASQEVVVLEDFADTIGLELDHLHRLINKYETKDNTWEQLKPLFEKITNEIDQFFIIDSIKKIIDADSLVAEQEKDILFNVLRLYSSEP